jgi:membrane-bound lytic murein transglycosylase D
MAANGIDSPQGLTIGKVLVIPGSETTSAQKLVTQKSSASYVVKKGDTLHAIARKFSTDPKTLLAANTISSPDKLKEGAVLTIPGSRPAAAAPSPAKPSTPTPKPFQVAQYTSQPPAASKPLPQSALPGPARVPSPTAAQPPASPTASKPTQPTAKPLASSAPAKAAPKNVSYKVAQGETVWGIAKKFNIEPKALMSTNNLKDASSLRAGDNLTIPSP